jgi:hypothetical protein
MRGQIGLLGCLAAILVTAPLARSASEPKTPQDISLNGRWQFAYAREFPAGAAAQPAPPGGTSFAADINIPGFWDDQIEAMRVAPWRSSTRFGDEALPPREDAPGRPSKLPFLEGVGWYRRSLTIPAEWRGRTVTLTVGGARTDCYLFVNGSMAGFHLANLTPFEFDLSERLRYGENNEIILAISNAGGPQAPPRVGGISFEGYQSYATGFFSGLDLHVSGGPGRIESVYLHPVRDFSAVAWRVDLKGIVGRKEARTRIQWRIRSHEGQVVKQGLIPVPGLDTDGRQHAEWEIPADGLKAWSTWEPHLYSVEVTWEDARGQVWDRRVQPAGFRALVSKDKRLLLNGRPILLRGVTDCYYWPPNVNPPASVEFYRNMIRRLKEVGYNHIRFHTWIPPREYMQAADELGMLLQVEPARGLSSSFGREYGRCGTGNAFCLEAWREMVRWSRIHPSVVIYCGGNEVMMLPGVVAFLEQQYAEAKKLDPSGLVLPMESLRGVEYPDWATEDLVAVPDGDPDPSTFHARLFKRIAQIADLFAAYSWGDMSHKNVLARDWRILEPRFAAYPRPVLVHELGIIGGYLDLSLESRYTGRTPSTPYRLVRETLAAAKRLDMAPRYYQNSARWQSMARKYLMENARKCASVKGYDHLAGWDTHWNLVNYGGGTLNEFFELKHGDTAEKVRQYNGESVVLLDNQRRYRFRTGERFAAPVLVSLYGGKPLREGSLHWQVADGHRLVLQGDQKGLSAPDGAVSSLGEVSFDWPALDAARKLTLSVKVKDADYDLANQWDFWVFPSRPDPRIAAGADEESLQKLAGRYAGVVPIGSNPDLRTRVVSKLTGEHVHHLAGGGHVVLLGSEPFAAADTTFQIGRSGRRHMDLATVVNQHPVFAYLPHEGYCDWQFESLLEKGRAVLFDEKLPIAFNPILEVAGFHVQPVWKAAIWEVQAGPGKLLVASCRFDVNDPAGAALLDGILEYATGTQFAPQTKASTKELLRLVPTPAFRPWWEKVQRIVTPQ